MGLGSEEGAGGHLKKLPRAKCCLESNQAPSLRIGSELLNFKAGTCGSSEPALIPSPEDSVWGHPAPISSRPPFLLHVTSLLGLRYPSPRSPRSSKDSSCPQVWAILDFPAKQGCLTANKAPGTLPPTPHRNLQRRQCQPHLIREEAEAQRVYDCDLHKMTALGLGQGLSRYPGHLSLISVAHRGVQWAPNPGRTQPWGWLSGKGLSYLVEPVVQQDNLCLARVRALPHQHIPWVGVAVHEAVDKDHLAIHLAQVA